MSDNDTVSALEAAEKALSRLPILGPVVWLMARTEDRKYMLVSDIETTIFPSVMLDQCRIFTQGPMPLAFVNWAWVSDEVHQRLSSGISRLAPHEWTGGPHLWIIDIIAPFGGIDDVLAVTLRESFPTQTSLRYLAFNPITRNGEVKHFTHPAPANPIM